MIRTAAVIIVFVVAVGLTLVGLLTHGVSASIFDVRITVRNPARPFAVAGIAAALLVASSPFAARGVPQVFTRVATGRGFTIAAWAIAAGIAVIAVIDGSFVASAADGYGYVAQGRLLAHGALSVPQEWAHRFAWPDVESVWSPFGFRPSLDGASLVPVYPPGFPLLMAGLATLGGEAAGYLVVPAASGLLVLGTFWLGRRVDGAATGLMAALLLACSPTFLFQACVPMSDVPASAAWTCAIVLALGRGSSRALLSGLCAGLAVLVRPNLAPLLVVPAVAIAAALDEPWRVRTRGLALFALGGLPSLVVLALLNHAWHGSPFASGYQVSELFGVEFFWTNLFSYPRWLVETQTAFILLAPIGLVVARRHRLVLALVPAIVGLCYAFYASLDHWTYLRFLLPAFPALLVLASACATHAIALPSRRVLPEGSFPEGPSRRVLVARVGAIALVGIVALSTWHDARIRGVFTNHVSLDRFVAVPRFARSALPDRAVFLTRLYSGSMREYGERLTVRWDVLDPRWLDRAIADLQQQHDAVYIVIEGPDERQQFVDRFAAHSRWGALDWPAAAEYRGIETVWLYDIGDLGRPADAVTTRAIPH